jgi:hypothetical protein
VNGRGFDFANRSNVKPMLFLPSARHRPCQLLQHQPPPLPSLKDRLGDVRRQQSEPHHAVGEAARDTFSISYLSRASIPTLLQLSDSTDAPAPARELASRPGVVSPAPMRRRRPAQ